jgi:hypothetical protein
MLNGYPSVLVFILCLAIIIIRETDSDSYLAMEQDFGFANCPVKYNGLHESCCINVGGVLH